MTVEITKCQCGHRSCEMYGVSNGTFYQGCGWEKETAEFVAWCFNNKKAIERYKNYLESANNQTLTLSRLLAPRDPAEARGVVDEAMVERAFTVIRRYDCFFLFNDATLRRLIGEWITAALATQQQEPTT